MTTTATQAPYTITYNDETKVYIATAPDGEVLTTAESAHSAKRYADGKLRKRALDAAYAATYAAIDAKLAAIAPLSKREGNRVEVVRGEDKQTVLVTLNEQNPGQSWHAGNGKVYATVGYYGETTTFPPTKTGMPNADKIVDAALRTADQMIAARKRELAKTNARTANTVATAAIAVTTHARVKVQASEYGVSVAVNNVTPELAAKLAAAMSAILSAEGA